MLIMAKVGWLYHVIVCFNFTMLLMMGLQLMFTPGLIFKLPVEAFRLIFSLTENFQYEYQLSMNIAKV